MLKIDRMVRKTLRENIIEILLINFKISKYLKSKLEVLREKLRFN